MADLVSSDTNVWIDFCAISATELPFRLPCTYIMWCETIENEICAPEGLKEALLAAGLVSVKINAEEFYLADEIGGRYPSFTTYDAVALSIAKCRGIVLMTGDKSLRKAALKEDVEVIGTIGVIDRLYEEDLIGVEEYCGIIQKLLSVNGGLRRLPEDELERRLVKATKRRR